MAQVAKTLHYERQMCVYLHQIPWLLMMQVVKASTTLVLAKYSDSKVHGANTGPIRGRHDPGGPQVGPMNFAIWVLSEYSGLSTSDVYSKLPLWLWIICLQPPSYELYMHLVNNYYMRMFCHAIIFETVYHYVVMICVLPLRIMTDRRKLYPHVQRTKALPAFLF